jgi:hypothetical protein
MGLSSTQAVVGLLISTVLPILVGLVTTRVTSGALKSLLLIVFTAANGFLNEWAAAGDHYNLAKGVLFWIVSLVTAVAVHYGAWQPLGVARKAQGALVTAPPVAPVPPSGPTAA